MTWTKIETPTEIQEIDQQNPKEKPELCKKHKYVRNRQVCRLVEDSNTTI